MKGKKEKLVVDGTDNESKLRAIHITIKQIASNTENITTADIAKVAAADLQRVIDDMTKAQSCCTQSEALDK